MSGWGGLWLGLGVLWAGIFIGAGLTEIAAALS